MKRYTPKEIEPKWQQIWEEKRAFEAEDFSAKPKTYISPMFPYPSGAGMHTGHIFEHAIVDAIARFYRANGHDVMNPMGWDSFGLPAENYAIKTGTSPQETTLTNISNFKNQLKRVGASIDWTREINTTNPEYYRWTQWIFTKFFERGLAYQKDSLQWWCPIDQTVLANEQVVNGKCWRHDGPDDPLAEKKNIKQWFFKITDYADALLEEIPALDWPEKIKTAQTNWIGKSQGAEIDFKVDADLKDKDFVLLHGFKGGNDKDFFPWLAKELEDHGARVFMPNLPNTDEPNIDEQVEFLCNNYEFTDKTVVVTHSLGGVVAMKLLPKLDVKIASLLMVAPPLRTVFRDNKKRPALERACDWQFDFSTIKTKAEKITVLYDVDDDIVFPEQPQEIADKLGCQAIGVVAKSQHFNSSQEPSIFEQLEQCIKVFTTRPDTIFGATYVVLAPEHPLAKKLATDSERQAVETYIDEAVKKSEIDRSNDTKEKTGVFTGSFATNPANGEKIPIWVADYVLYGYGTGAIMAVPAHDERDRAFAEKFELPIIRVVDENANLIHSEQFDGQNTNDVREEIVAWLEQQGVGKSKVTYKMRDWLISRQRYWGAPIPIIHCDEHGAVAVPEDQLPVVLPEVKDYAPRGDGKSVLAHVEEWVNTTCPTCGKPAKRETDTMDGYACSSWYLLRYTDPQNDNQAWDPKLANFWAPVDFYVGGDHAVAHLLYVRFWTHVFKDMGLVDFKEPVKKLVYHGLISAEDGRKMSKSLGNTVDPLEIIDQGYGADALRTFELFLGPIEDNSNWNSRGIAGVYRFINRIWTLVQEFDEADKSYTDNDAEVIRLRHKTVRKVTSDIRRLSFNTAISALMEYVNDLYKLKVDGFSEEAWRDALSVLVQLVAPFAPHIAEELWQQLGHEGLVHDTMWPEWDDALIVEDTVTVVVQVNGKLRAKLEVAKGIAQEDIQKLALESENVKAFVGDKEPAKVIYVPNKLVNIVVK